MVRAWCFLVSLQSPLFLALPTRSVLPRVFVFVLRKRRPFIKSRQTIESLVVEVGEAKSRGWVGRGSCLLEDKKKIHICSLSARFKFAIARSRINFPESLYEMLNKGKLSPFNYEHFFLLVWQTISVKLN